jgi:hypothetical protein
MNTIKRLYESMNKNRNKTITIKRLWLVNKRNYRKNMSLFILFYFYRKSMNLFKIKNRSRQVYLFYWQLKQINNIQKNIIISKVFNLSLYINTSQYHTITSIEYLYFFTILLLLRSQKTEREKQCLVLECPLEGETRSTPVISLLSSW